MNPPRYLRPLFFLALASALSAAEPRPVVDFTQIGVEMLALPSPGNQVAVTTAPEGGLHVAIAPGPLNYPGITFNFAQDTLALDDCGYIEVSLTNTSEVVLSLNLRVDSIPSGAIPRGRATGTAYLKPGESGVARAYFNSPARDHAPVSPNHIKQILIFTSKSTENTRSFRVNSLDAGGTPGEQPSAS